MKTLNAWGDAFATGLDKWEHKDPTTAFTLSLAPPAQSDAGSLDADKYDNKKTHYIIYCSQRTPACHDPLLLAPK